MQRDAQGPGVLERVERLKQDLLAKVRALGRELPVNTLDELIDRLGGPERVAEVGAASPCWLPWVPACAKHSLALIREKPILWVRRPAGQAH